MNLQPPDPPEYGHCLTCHRSVHESEVRGGHCIECEEKTMASKTIAELAEKYEAVVRGESSAWVCAETFAKELRALLAAPVAEPPQCDLVTGDVVCTRPRGHSGRCLMLERKVFAAPIVERQEPIALFEAIIGKNPEAFLHQPVYQVTESEVREFAQLVVADRKRKHLRSCQIAIGKSQLAKEFQAKLTAAEQRNAELVELLRDSRDLVRPSAVLSPDGESARLKIRLDAELLNYPAPGHGARVPGCADAAWLLYDGNLYGQHGVLVMDSATILQKAKSYAGYKPTESGASE